MSERPKNTWLYNLAADPSEENNLSETNADKDKDKELMVLLATHKASARKSLYPYTVEISVALDKSLVKRFESGNEFIFWPN